MGEKEGKGEGWGGDVTAEIPEAAASRARGARVAMATAGPGPVPRPGSATPPGEAPDVPDPAWLGPHVPPPHDVTRGADDVTAATTTVAEEEDEEEGVAAAILSLEEKAGEGTTTTAPVTSSPGRLRHGEEEEVPAAMLASGEASRTSEMVVTSSPERLRHEEEEEATAAMLASGEASTTLEATVTSSPERIHHSEEEAAMLASGEASTISGVVVTSSPEHSRHGEEEEVPAAILASGEASTTSEVVVTSSPERLRHEEEATAAISASGEASATLEMVVTSSPERLHHGEEATAMLGGPMGHKEEEEKGEEVPPTTSPEVPTSTPSSSALPSVPSVPSSSSSWGCGRRGGEEDVTASGWRGRRKHVFILSEAGKPIYSRHGNEEALAATMGVMMALVSFIQSGGNAIRAICSEDRTLVFEQRGPLLLVSVSRTRQSAAQLRRELTFVHEQILSLLTRGGIARVFARRRGYDLRRLLAGAEAVLDRLLSGAAADGRLLLGAARCLPLPAPLRRGVSGALRRAAAAAVPSPALALVAAGGRLVTAARQRALAEGGRLCASDLHLLLNLLGSGVGAGEVWTPVCLPRFNPDGYFYAYAAALGEEEEGGGGGAEAVTLILLSTEREGFYAAAGCRRRLEETLRAQGWLGELGAAARGGAGYGPGRPGAPELRHFLYKPLEGPEEMQQLPQFTSPELEEPYTSEEERHRLFDLYHYLHSRVHSPHRPLRLLYHVAEKETLLAWVTSKFELYGCFSPLVTKAGAIGVLTKLLRWVKKEEDWLFIRYPPPYCATTARPEGAEAEG